MRSPQNLVTLTGLELPPKTPENPVGSDKSAAFSDAFSADSTPADAVLCVPNLPPDVADLARRLAALPETVRAGIVAMVRAAVDAKGK